MGKAASALKSQEEMLKVVAGFIEDVKKVCAEKGLVFMEAYLVGSRARGDYVEDSDADVVLLIDGVQGLVRIDRMRLFLDVMAPKVEFTV
ncbi:MAG: nucleotidyltransferase domain-containing protein [Candidatus Caldarchaeum sp.]|nr:nucleotidyltransferase domain-containing protein [Candidatus Caldarchaeum sp.]MDW7977963.1 nucleotidyltransferase domain-containing protein [Candidatus Caldarchaeum sp.]